MSSSDRLRDAVFAALRVMTGLLFLQHGLVKIFGFPEGVRPGAQPLLSLAGTAGMIELVGGAMIVLGLFSRPVAFILSGEMAVAYFMSHAPRGFMPIVNNGELAILFCFVFLFIAVAGGGAWSLDARMGGLGRLSRRRR